MDEIKKAINDSRGARWTVLVIVSLLMFATYWFQDFMSPLQGLMRDAWGFSNSDFGLIISCTTWLNMIGAIIVGGMILDKFGPKICIFLFGGIAFLGSVICALGAAGFFGEDPMVRRNSMMVGRLLFGIGLEVTCVLVSKTVVKWFKGHELALAMGVNVGFGRLGSMLAIMFSADIAGASPSPAVTLSAAFIGVGVLAFIGHLIFDAKLDRDRKAISAEGEESGGDDEQFKVSDLWKLLSNPSFVYVALLCVTFYSAVFPFIQYAPDLLINKFGFSQTLPDLKGAGFGTIVSAWLTNGPKVAGLIPFGTLFFTPIFGSIVDRKGKAASLMMVGSGLLIFAHLSLSVFNSVALGYAGLLSLGIAFSLVPAAMWPSVAKIVPESRLGTAYATMFTIQNIGLGGFFWGIGKMLDMANAGNIEAINAGEAMYDYTKPILMLVFLGVISIFLAYMLKRADKKQGYGLELPSGQTPD